MAYDGQPSPFLLQAAFDACKTLALVEDAATGEIREFPLAQVQSAMQELLLLVESQEQRVDMERRCQRSTLDPLAHLRFEDFLRLSTWLFSPQRPYALVPTYSTMDSGDGCSASLPPPATPRLRHTLSPTRWQGIHVTLLDEAGAGTCAGPGRYDAPTSFQSANDVAGLAERVRTLQRARHALYGRAFCAERRAQARKPWSQEDIELSNHLHSHSSAARQDVTNEWRADALQDRQQNAVKRVGHALRQGSGSSSEDAKRDARRIRERQVRAEVGKRRRAQNASGSECIRPEVEGDTTEEKHLLLEPHQKAELLMGGMGGSYRARFRTRMAGARRSS